MAIEKVIEIKLSAQEAEKNLKAINKTLEEQREILILLEKELLDVQDAQNKTSKTNLAAQKQLTTQSNHLKSAIRDQKLGLKSLNIERREAADVLAGLNKGSKDNINIIRAVDKLTGGYATKIVKLKKGFLSSIKGAKRFIGTLKGVKGALISTGIGALVVALGLIVAYWEDIKGFVDGTTKAQKEGLAEAEKLRDVTQKQLDITNSMENTLKAQGKTEKEIRDLKIQQTNEVIAATEAQLAQQQSMKKSQIEAAERNRNILSGILKFLSLPLAMVLKAYDYITGSNTSEIFDTAAELIFDPTEVAEEGNAAIEETEAQLIKLKNTRDGYILQEQKEKKSQAEKTKANKKKEDDAEIQAEKDKQAALERIRKGEIDTEEERRAEELFQVQEQYRKLIEEADKYNQSTTELIEAQGVKEQELKDKFAQQDKDRKDKADKEAAEKKLEEQEKLIEELELKKENEELSFDEQRQLIADREQLLIEDKTLTDEQRLQLEGQFTDAKIKLAEAEAAAKDKTLGETADVLQKFSGIAGEETAAGKALGIASATINTYRGVSDALAAKTVTPFETALKFANAGAILASGLQNVQKIVSVKVPRTSGGGGGAAATGGSAPAPPSFNVVGASETSVLADTVAEQTNEPVQAYVVSNDVTTAQSLENNIVEGATL